MFLYRLLRLKYSADHCGRDWFLNVEASAEGATAPETLRQNDRSGMRLWKVAV